MADIVQCKNCSISELRVAVGKIVSVMMMMSKLLVVMLPEKIMVACKEISLTVEFTALKEKRSPCSGKDY